MKQSKFIIILVTLIILMSFAMGCKPVQNDSNDIAIIEPESSATPIQPTQILPTSIPPTLTPYVDLSKIRFSVDAFEFMNPNKGGPITSIAFSPDNNFLAMAGSGHISIIETRNLTIPYILEGHTDFMLGLDWTPDGSILISANQDGSVILWETE